MYLEKQLVPQVIEKARKHTENLLKGSNIDLIKICVAMYDSAWDGDIWDSPDESDEEVIDSVPRQPLTKEEITTHDPQGNNPQRWDTTNVRDFNVDYL